MRVINWWRTKVFKMKGLTWYIKVKCINIHLVLYFFAIFLFCSECMYVTLCIMYAVFHGCACQCVWLWFNTYAHPCRAQRWSRFLFLHHFSTMLFEKTSLIEPGAQLLTRLVCQWAQSSIHLCPPHYSTTIWSSPFIYVLGIPNQVFMFCVANTLWAESFPQTIKIFLIVSLIFSLFI